MRDKPELKPCQNSKCGMWQDYEDSNILKCYYLAAVLCGASEMAERCPNYTIAKPSEWIRVSTPPPATPAQEMITTETESDIVLLYSSEGWNQETGFFCHNMQRWYSPDGNYSELEVTHWQPLPPPPDKETK